jgi:glycosyltransferase involved in cell wall biosynthesis
MKPGKKILISHTSTYKKAGWGRIFPLAAGLVKIGNDVTILTTNPKYSFLIKKQTINGVRILIFPEIIPARISRMGFGFLSLFLKIIHALLNRYDVVHSDNGHRPLSGIPCRLNKKMYGSVYVAEWYDWYGKGGQYDNKKKLFKIVLGGYELKNEIRDKKIADGVVVVSEILRTRAEKFKSGDRVIKIHGGADVAVIPFLPDNSHLKTKYGINEDILTLGYINSDSYRLAEFLPLINVISRYNLSSRVQIVVFGESGSLIRQLSHEISERMKFFGWIDFSKDFEKLQLIDVFFLLKEEILGNKAGWPNCIGDYLACGRPVLLNPVGEIVDFVEKYPFAFITTTKEEEDVYNKVQFILNNLRQIRENGSKIRNLAEKVVSWERKSMDLFDFYTFLLKNKAD